MLLADSPDAQEKKKPHKTVNLFHMRLNSLIWFMIALFFIECLLIFLTGKSPPLSIDRTANVTQSDSAALHTSRGGEAKCPCVGVYVYVYNLPSRFNKGLLPQNCRNYSDQYQYSSECAIATNHGFGAPAEELRGVVPENLVQSWYRTDQFSLEVIFHRRIVQHRCRTRRPESAAAFYIPFYGGLAVEKYLWRDSDVPKRDRPGRMLLKWLNRRSQWRRSNGSDHFLTLGRMSWDFRRRTDPNKKWGSDFLNRPGMANPTRFLIEKAPGDHRDFSVPYPTGFHPKTLDALTQWQDFVRRHNRTHLFTFTGATRPHIANDFRAILRRHCQDEPESCWLVDCSGVRCAGDSSETTKALLGSDFCLQPMGDSFTRKSVFDCMVAGSVPVFFWTRTAYEEYQYEGFLPAEPESYSVYIDHEDVRSGTLEVKQVLMKYSEGEIRKKREKVIETIPRIIYGDNEGGLMNFKDAFDFAVDRVMRRMIKEGNLHSDGQNENSSL